MGWCFVVLGIAICFAWLPSFSVAHQRVSASTPPFLIATLLGVGSGVITWPGLFVLAALAGAARLSLTTEGAVRGLFVVVTVAIALALALHLAPGFHNPKLFDAVRLSRDAAPFSQYLNFDKGAAGLVILSTYAPRAKSAAELGRILRATLPIAAGTAIATIALALSFEYVRVDPKLPLLTVAFLATNLFFTSIPEEAFFRGFLQERLTGAVSRWPSLRWMPATFSGVIFGLAHASAGSTYLLLATVAGLGYSLAYAVTRRVEGAVVAHFVVNATQFLGFTYPYLARG